MSQTSWNPETVKSEIRGFLDPLIDAAGFDLDYKILKGGGADGLVTPELTVDFSGPDVELLLSHRGEVLLALEQLTLEILRISHEDRYKLIFDADDYRMMRIEELKMSAEAAAEKVRRTGMPFHFQPMTSRERRIIHLALRDEEGVTSASEGVAPRRHTVIYPEK